MAQTLEGFNKLLKNSKLVSIHERGATGENVYETKGTCESSLRFNDVHKK